MNHKQIKEKEIVERYALNRLSADERRAFQEHFFDCDECFEQSQMASRFIAGVRAKSASMILTEIPESETRSFWRGWLSPAFAFSTALSILLALTLAWLLFNRVPNLRQEIALERQARQQLERENKQSLETSAEQLKRQQLQLETERTEREKLQSRLENLRRDKLVPLPDAQPNLPIATLDATRDSQSSPNRLDVPSASVSVALWMEVEPGDRFDHYIVRIFAANGILIETVSGAKPNIYGALAVSIPARRLPSGKYVVKLYGVKGQKEEPAGDYDLEIRRP